jgi:hypothetical protein
MHISTKFSPETCRDCTTWGTFDRDGVMKLKHSLPKEQNVKACAGFLRFWTGTSDGLL